MINAPTSTVTFLFADVEGSISPSENHATSWMRDTLARHDRILRKAVEDNGGSVFKTLDEAFCAAFATVKQALEAAMTAKRGLSAQRNGHAGERVRMALHTGVAEERDGDYFGPSVDRVARLLSAGRGGQVLLSADTYGLVRDTLGFSELGAELRDLGEHPLEDAGSSEQIFQLLVPDSLEEVPPPKLSDERYDLKELIGSGGMAEVYLARDRELDRDVAFKRLRPQYAHDEEVVERFEREAKSAASLSHPNIVSVYDRGETEDGSYYIVMEHVPGGNLKDRILEKGLLPPDEAAAIALQVARALEAAHERGVVHRDVKPQNVLLTESGEAKVADFGIARAVAASTVTKTGFVVGTAHYLSPEQALGHPATPRSDLYSLGVVLYEVLTGELPHDAETQVGIVMKHVSGRLQPPRDVNPEVPEELDAVVVRLLARDPEDRYRDAAEVIKDLERVQRGEHPAMAATQQLEQQAPSPATTPPEDDKRRRWRWIPIPLILLLLALLGGTAYAFGPWRTAPEAPVPNLVGASSIEEARQMAGDRFEVVEGDRVESREAVGTVVGQSPYAGEMADEGSEISVDVVGTRIAEVPDVEGASRAEAERTLEEAGFEVTVETKESSAANENLVTGQDSQGETAEVGSTITITVGKGPAKIEVPSINNQALGGTEQVLAEAGLKLGNQTVAPSVRVPAGHIVEQRPAAGTGVEPGSTVDVVVSSGPQQLPSSNGDDDASQTVGSTAPASTAPASAAPALRADDEDEIGHEDEIGDEDRDEYRDDDYDERENEGRERD
jgi:beta-lactam-binding protein with PASTA domain/class 3 adenylate cyclase/tRNA A-37 threonylcarbamoyl transferase component Bud32